MTENMETRYSPETVEDRIYQAWMESGCFHADPARKSQRGPYSIVIPPPNVTGALHLGHALNNTLQDILVRYHRMRGHNTLWMPGTDHAGIATQSVVEKQILEKEGKSRHDLGRDELVRRIWQWREQYGNRILQQLQRMGCSCDWLRTRFTLDDVCARAVRTAFVRLFEKGLIYRGKRLVNWDPVLQTALSDDELQYETVNTHFWYINYPLADGSGHVTVATTRPETMLGDTAVAINPKDPRARELAGKSVILPLMERDIPIIADDYVTLPDPQGDEKARISTGFLKVTPAHDPNDYQIGIRHNLPLVNIFNPDATVNENGGKYRGMDRFAARKAVVRDLETLGLLEKTIPYRHEIAHSERSKAPVEPSLSDQWFIATTELAGTASRMVREGKIRFFPERYADTYLDWLANLRDWCISRQLWWGHRIPIWSQELELPADVAPSPVPGHELNAQVMAALQRAAGGNWTEFTKGGGRYHLRIEDHPEKTGWIRTYICLHDDEADLKQRIETAGWVQDPDVLDTWFSSALWPFSTMGWPEKTAELATWYPTNVLVTSRDIISLWVCRMVMMGCFNLDQVPFRHVYIHTKILDGKGETMSKSKGNGVDPLDIISQYGADAMRFSLAYMTTESQDARMPVKKEKLPDGRTVNVSEKFEIGRNFCNKLWNASRFVISNLDGVADAPPVTDDELAFEDHWILSCLTAVVEQSTAALEDRYAFSDLSSTLYAFTWHQFCDWYVELSKPRLAAGGRARQVVQKLLAFVLDNTLRLLHPIICFETEELWQRLNDVLPDRSLNGRLRAPASEKLILASWPEFPGELRNPTLESEMQLRQDMVRAIRDIRARMGLSPRTQLTALVSAGDKASELRKHDEFISLMANLQAITIEPRLDKPPFSATGVIGSIQVFVPLKGLIDLQAERERLTRRAAELEKGVAAIDKKLANESFLSRAPEDLVQSERDRRKALSDELNVIRAGLDELAQWSQ